MKKKYTTGYQFSIFDIDEIKKSEERLVKELDLALGLKNIKSNPKDMVEALVTAASRDHGNFPVDTRLFIRDSALKVFRNQTFSDKQVGYLRSLYSRVV